MKKDQKIEKQLERLISVQEAPPMELLSPALELLERQNIKKAAGKRRFRRIFAGATVTAALIVAIVVPIAVNIAADNRIYSLATTSVSAAGLPEGAEELFPDLTHVTGTDVIPEYYVYSLNESVITVNYRARRLAKYAIEDVSIYAELTDYRAEELSPYEKNSSYTYLGSKYTYNTYSAGGEYYSEYYAELSGVRYYMEIMSPISTSTQYYLKKLFEKI